jgi:hypothetical protein
MKSSIEMLKRLLPDRDMDLRILRGPLRGGKFHSRPRASLRKIFGLYEHELNGWLASVLPQIDLVIDVGANDGYFTFGCAAAMRRRGKAAHVLAFEPDAFHVRQLEQAKDVGKISGGSIEIIPSIVGRATSHQIVTLDQFIGVAGKHERALIKIDVEGSELDVIAGGKTWLRPSNFFLIEIHCANYLRRVRDVFLDAGLALEQINQRPLPVLGRETRDTANWWLVTDLANQG